MKNTILYACCFALASLPASVSAVNINNPLTGGTDTTVLSPAQLIGRVVQSLLGIAGVLSIAVVIWGGIKIIIGSAQGNDQMIGEGKKALLYAFIGLIVAFLGFIAVNLLIDIITSSLTEAS